MKIKNECFYDMVSHEILEFSPRQVQMVAVQPADIVTVDLITMEAVSEETVYCVIASLENGIFAATRPFTDEDYANHIAVTLSEYCEDAAHGN